MALESRVQGKERTMPPPHREQIEEKGHSSMAEPLSGMPEPLAPSPTSLGTKDKKRETEGKEVLRLAAWMSLSW